MSTKTVTAHRMAPFTGLIVLCGIALVLALAGVLVFAANRSLPAQMASPATYRMSPEQRNRRLLELNEGIKPVVRAVPVNRNRRLLELNEGIMPVVKPAPANQNRLLELNEGYVPAAPYVGR